MNKSVANLLGCIDMGRPIWLDIGFLKKNWVRYSRGHIFNFLNYIILVNISIFYSFFLKYVFLYMYANIFNT